jgi:uncharacterized protein
MHSRALGEGGGTESTHMVFFDPGEEAIEGLTSFARENDIEVASFTAIGGFESASIGFFNLETRGFDEIPFAERQVEVLSLVGEITTDGDGPFTQKPGIALIEPGETRRWRLGIALQPEGDPRIT